MPINRRRAINLRRPPVGLIHHSDRGSQYCFNDYRRMLRDNGFVASMSGRGLPEEMHNARPKRLRFLVLNRVGKIIRHARETLLRCPNAVARALADAPQVSFRLVRPALAGD